MYVKTLTAAFVASIIGCSAANAHVYWQDGFESGDFTGWSYAQGPDPSQGGPGPDHVYVTNQSQSGIPPQNGNSYAHFERPASATNYPHAKVYKEWSTIGKLDQWRRVEDKLFNGPSVSATYVAWYYFPTNYQATQNWVNIFQFKESGYDKNGVPMQNPSWWLNVGPASSFGLNSSSTPYVFVNYWGNNYASYHPKVMPVPLGRWFEVRVHLYQGDRIEWLINGHLLDVSYNSTWPVGRFYPKSTGWTFGVGHYGGYGTVFIDHCYVMTNP